MAPRPAGVPAPMDTRNAFARHTMAERIPAILRDVLASNPDYPAPIQSAVEQLRQSLLDGAPIPMLADEPAPPADYEAWAAAYRAQRARFEPLTWQRTEWFFAEMFLYRHLIQAVRWAETGRDPFAPQKQAELNGERLWTALDRILAFEGSDRERLANLLLSAVWGNQADLSHAVGQGAGEDHREEGEGEAHQNGLHRERRGEEAADEVLHSGTVPETVEDQRPELPSTLCAPGPGRGGLAQVVRSTAAAAREARRGREGDARGGLEVHDAEVVVLEEREDPDVGEKRRGEADPLSAGPRPTLRERGEVLPGEGVAPEMDEAEAAEAVDVRAREYHEDPRGVRPAVNRSLRTVRTAESDRNGRR